MPSIDEIEGITPKSATRLRKSGVKTAEGLLRRAATKKGRAELAGATGFTPAEILAWVNRADLMRVRGVGSEYGDLLEHAGVDTVKELRRRNATSLAAKMIEINEEKRLVRRLPTEGMIASWIEQANELEPLVKH